MTDRSDPTGGSWRSPPPELGPWTLPQEDACHLARQVLNILVAAYAAWIDRTEDPTERGRPHGAQAAVVAQRHMLVVTDDDTVRRTLRDYPALLRRLGESDIR